MNKYQIINLKYKYEYSEKEKKHIKLYLKDILEYKNDIGVGIIDDMITFNYDQHQLEFSYQIVLNTENKRMETDLSGGIK